MKLKLDENLPAELCVDLRAAGHEADSIVDEGLAGKPDEAILEHARLERRVLMTMDKGIADVRVHPPDQHAGIVLLRPKHTGRGNVLAFARDHLPGVLRLDLPGRLVVITEAGFRIRSIEYPLADPAAPPFPDEPARTWKDELIFSPLMVFWAWKP